MQNSFEQDGLQHPQMLTVGEAAAILGVSISTLRNWDRQGKLSPVRHPINDYRLYPTAMIQNLRTAISGGSADALENQSGMASFQGVETNFDVSFVTPMAFAEKQIQQAYRPYIQVHKWFARRPGTLFRALLLSEFGDVPLADAFLQTNDLSGSTIFDPFMGGGTPAVEANRLGINVVACDINPMAEWIVRQELGFVDLDEFVNAAEEVTRRVDAVVGSNYRTRCVHCGGDAEVKYFIWVKTVTCESCGRPVQLFPGYLVAGNARHPNHVLVCPCCHDLFELPDLPERGTQVSCTKCGGTFVNEPVAQRNSYTCGACGHKGRYPSAGTPDTPPNHSMIAIEYHCPRCKPDHQGRFFKAPDLHDIETYGHAGAALELSDHKGVIPSESIPAGDETARLHRWGYRRYRDMFNDRQLLGLSTLASTIREVENAPVRRALATVFSDFLRYQNMLCRYDTYALKCQDIFSVHGFPVGLVQCENNLLGIPNVGSGGFRHFVQKYLDAKKYCDNPFEVVGTGSAKRRIDIAGEKIAAEFVDKLPGHGKRRQAWLICSPSDEVNVPSGSIDAVMTDPPYFDNLQYAELMDFCYVWLRRLAAGDSPYFVSPSTRSAEELTGNKTEGRDLACFTEGMSRVYCNAAKGLKSGGLFAFTYHHNDVAAYLPLVVALSDAGLVGTASIPCPAEMSASLHIAKTGSSVVDTVLCGRKPGIGVSPAEYSPDRFADELLNQTQQLIEGGLTPSYGDVRCMALGLATIFCINRLAESWDSGVSVDEKVRRADECMTTTINEAGGLETLVSKVIADMSQEKARPSARTLFGQQLKLI